MKYQVNKSFPKINQVKLKPMEGTKTFKDYSTAKIPNPSEFAKTKGQILYYYNAYIQDPMYSHTEVLRIWGTSLHMPEPCQYELAYFSLDPKI